MNNDISTSDIKGWGVDRDPLKRPAYPMWSKPEEGTGAHWEQPEKQELEFTVLKSIERPEMTSAFGTSVPPRGLSGVIRKLAFKYSESSFGHWIPLLMADRVNMVEGLLDDLRRGHIPNIFKEMGLKSEFKYNRKSAIRKTIMVGLLLSAAPLLFTYLSNRKNPKSL